MCQSFKALLLPISLMLAMSFMANAQEDATSPIYDAPKVRLVGRIVRGGVTRMAILKVGNERYVLEQGSVVRVTNEDGEPFRIRFSDAVRSANETATLRLDMAKFIKDQGYVERDEIAIPSKL